MMRMRTAWTRTTSERRRGRQAGEESAPGSGGAHGMGRGKTVTVCLARLV